MNKKSKYYKTLLGSGSGLFRSLECPASEWLKKDRAALMALLHKELYEHLTDQEWQAKQAEWNETTERGTAAHLYLQFAMDSKRDKQEVLERIDPKYHKYLAKIDLTRVAGKYTPLYNREVALVYNPETKTARDVPVPDFGHRDYGELNEVEIPSTADVIIPGFRTLEVWDYKFGVRDVAAEGNVQLLESALAAKRLFVPSATTFVLGIQQVDKDAVVKNNVWVTDSVAVEEYEEKVIAATEKAKKVKLAVVNNETPECNPGDYCTFCNARPNCEAGQAFRKEQLKRSWKWQKPAKR